jgi:hypothetical protein
MTQYHTTAQARAFRGQTHVAWHLIVSGKQSPTSTRHPNRRILNFFEGFGERASTRKQPASPMRKMPPPCFFLRTNFGLPPVLPPISSSNCPSNSVTDMYVRAFLSVHGIVRGCTLNATAAAFCLVDPVTFSSSRTDIPNDLILCSGRYIEDHLNSAPTMSSPISVPIMNASLLL